MNGNETLTNINIGNVEMPLEETMHLFAEIDNAKVGEVIDAPISHFNFQFFLVLKSISW